jgi:F-type H+-transporting ATPase subunit a
LNLKVSLYPEHFYVFGINVGLSVVIAWAVMAVLILALIAIRIFVISKFQKNPKGFQNVLEMTVEGIYSFAKNKVGHDAAKYVAPIAMTFMTYIFFTTFVELFGLPPATEDLNCTIAMGLCSFFTVNIVGIKCAGLKGRLKNLANPKAIVAPIRILTDCIAPFSMGIRLFANVLVGGVIMQLIYAVLPILLPAAVASYFNVLHVGIQTFVFGLLFLTYVSEAVGEVAE